MGPDLAASPQDSEAQVLSVGFRVTQGTDFGQDLDSGPQICPAPRATSSSAPMGNSSYLGAKRSLL